MNAQQSKQMVLVSALALIAIAVYRQQGDPGTLFKRVWGTGALTVMLSLVADFAPTVAGPFAVVAVLGALTHGGDSALTNLASGFDAKTAGIAGGKTAAAAATKPSAGVVNHPEEGSRGPKAPAAPKRP